MKCSPISLVVSLFAAGLAQLGCPLVSAAADRPNVLLIMTDDQGWGDMSSHGNDILETPTLDALAKSGAEADRFYVCSVCAPTRASLLTGRYRLRTGVHGVTRGQEDMRSSETTMAEALAEHGYRCGCFGKWHNGAQFPRDPLGQGFHEFLGFCGGHWNNYFDTQLQENRQDVHTEGYITDVLTDRAIQFMEAHRERPFFCYLPYNAPHSPWQVPDAYYDKYKAKGLDPTQACAYAMCENLDDNIGRLLQALDRLELSKRTIVIFLTDNGPNSDRFNGGMRGRKGSVHEGGIRVPLLVRWNGTIPAGKRIRPICAHIDLLPTVLDLCDLPLPQDVKLDGRSLKPLLLDEQPTWPSRMIFSARGRSPFPGAARDDRWRAVRYGSRWELYDMVADPGQKKNVAGDHPDLVRKFAGAYREWHADVTEAGFDRLPIHVGHAEAPSTLLPGHEAELHGPKISYVGRSGWANDWITNWTGAESYPSWPVRVVRGGRYAVRLKYACPESAVGSKLQAVWGDAALLFEVARPAAAPRVASPDRVPRKEVVERQWGELMAGTWRLAPGEHDLKILPQKMVGEALPEIKAVVLERVD